MSKAKAIKPVEVDFIQQIMEDITLIKMNQSTLEQAVNQIGKDLITTSQRLRLLKSDIEREMNDVRRKSDGRKQRK